MKTKAFLATAQQFFVESRKLTEPRSKTKLSLTSKEDSDARKRDTRPVN